jgi:hypothetical protein
VSELNFKEIEKAMAELVNKTQGQQREKQLNSVVRKRDQITKKKEDKIGQGIVATKRIIIGNKGLRANLANPRVNSAMPASAKSNPISDFRPPAPKPLISDEPGEEVIESQEDKVQDPPLDQTVGDLSNQYLTKEVSKPYEPEFITPEAAQEEITDDELNGLDNSNEKETSEQSGTPLNSEVEAQAGQDSTLSLPVEELDLSHPTVQDNLPEAEELSQSLDDPTYDRGAVHRIYGQKMPTHHTVNSFAQDQGSDNQKDKLFKSDLKKESKAKKAKSGHGFLFYLVIFLVLASLAAWGFAIYLYLMPQ